MKTLYFDCFSGISGDMTIGALVDLGVDFDYMKSEIEKLPIDGFELRLGRTVRANISAAKFDVQVQTDDDRHHDDGHRHRQGHVGGHSHEEHRHAGDDDADHHPHRRASEIIDMVRGSPLGGPVRDRAIAIFQKLAISEGRVHQMPPEDVEFHEVGAIDSIVDVVGAAIGLEALDVDRFACSPINVGGGFIHCQHGVYPVPAPATANLLGVGGATVYSRHVDVELVTPTGAAILAATIDRFGVLEPMTIEKVGYGAGTKDLGDFPNCLRLFLGRAEEEPQDDTVEDVVVIETNVDDMRAEGLAYAVEALFDAGALDVVTIPVLMKKGRPGHLLQILVAPDKEQQVTRKLFGETTTIGVRKQVMRRAVLDREQVAVLTPGGRVNVKVARLGGRVMNVSPEYEDCARLARSTGRGFEEIRNAALRAYENMQKQDDGNG